MTIIKSKLPCGCVLDVHEKTGKIAKIDFDIRTINQNCPLVWEMLGRGLTKGVFQLESPLGRQWCKELKPQSIFHLAALGSILRPGCLRNLDENNVSTTKHYCLRKNGLEPVSYYHPSLEEILSESYGLLIYQEQSLMIAARLGGFTLAEADILRRAIGKKDSKLLAEVEKTFIEKAENHGVVTREQAIEIFKWVRKSERYSFNKCLNPNTLVEKKDGSFVTLEEIKVGEKINTPEGFSEVVNKYDNGDKEVYRITLESGLEIECTLDHKFLCNNGEVLPLYEILERELSIVTK